jgi:hypothetical protein
MIQLSTKSEPVQMISCVKAVVLATVLASPAISWGQGGTSGAAAPATAPMGPPIGSAAPDFTLPGATRYGLLKTPIHLSDYRGETVVLAFFFEARTKG